MNAHQNRSTAIESSCSTSTALKPGTGQFMLHNHPQTTREGCSNNPKDAGIFPFRSSKVCVRTWVGVVERTTVNVNSSTAHVHQRARTLRRGERLAPTIILTETTYAFTLHTHDEMCCLTVVCNVVRIGEARIGSPYPPLLSLYLFPSRSL